MDNIFALLERFGPIVIFVNMLLTAGGVPVPVYPTLVTAAALSAAGGAPLPAILATATAASMLADIAWFQAGRRRGRRILNLLCKLSMSPDFCVRQTESLSLRYGRFSLLFAKFLPGLNTINIVLTATGGTTFLLFLVLDLIGSVLFVSVPLVLGYLFRDAIDDALETLAALGKTGAVLLVVALAIYLAVKKWQRLNFQRQLRMDRITVPELLALIAGGHNPVILDVRPKTARIRDGVIPGALPGHSTELDGFLSEIPRDRDVVVYCSCPNEASAAVASQHLKRAGFARIRPLLGGVEAWIAHGKTLEPLS